MQTKLNQRSFALKIIFFLLLTLSLVVPARPAYAATLCVDTSGGGCYTTIQAAINAASNGDVINIHAGTYRENVLVNKQVEIAGASQAGVIVQPATSNPVCSPGSLCGGAASNVFFIQAHNVKIHDLTVDGDNPTLTSSQNISGANIDARNGIITDTSVIYNNLEIYNTTVKNIYLRGIQIYGGTFNFHDNTLTNINGGSDAIAMFNYGGQGAFTRNTISNTAAAIASNWSTGSSYSFNIITDSRSGIHTDNNGGSGGGSFADDIYNNTISACKTGGWGIWVFVPYRNVNVHDNSSTCEVALALLGASGGVPLFNYNTLDSGGAVGGAGIYITTDTFGYGDYSAAASLSNNTIANAETGLAIDRTGVATLNITETFDTFTTGISTGIDNNADLNTNNVVVNATGDALIVRNGGNVSADNLLDLNGNVNLLSGGALTAGTNNQINVAGNWTNNGAFTANSGTVRFDGAVAQNISGASPTAFNILDLANTHANGISSAVDLTVNGALAMNQDSALNMGAHILTMGASSAPLTTGIGQGDVFGTVLRSHFSSGTSYNFGSPFLGFMNFTFSAAPTDVRVTLSPSAPATKPDAILRTYTLTVNGGADILATLRLHYRDDAATLNGNIEAQLNFYRYGGTWTNLNRSSQNVGSNYVELAGVASFSDWTLASEIQTPVTPTSPTTTTLKTASLPKTGFAPNRTTTLPAQPVEKSYAALGDLWLEIPALGVKTDIVGVPKTDGEWDVSWLNANIGWLDGSAFPTWQGNSALTAHVTDANGKAGPFANLKDLKYGDQILIHLSGQTYAFEVRQTKTILPSSVNSALEHLEDHSYLTLITCQTYSPFSDSYLFRRVVRAVLIDMK